MDQIYNLAREASVVILLVGCIGFPVALVLLGFSTRFGTKGGPQ